METDLPKAAGRLLLRLQSEMFREIALAGFDDIRPRHGAILAYLVPQGRRLSDFADLTGQHKQVIGTVADEVVALGYITREPDRSDRRAKLLVPTARGLGELAASTRVITGLESRIADAIGRERMCVMRDAMFDAAAALAASVAADGVSDHDR